MCSLCSLPMVQIHHFIILLMAAICLLYIILQPPVYCNTYHLVRQVPAWWAACRRDTDWTPSTSVLMDIAKTSCTGGEGCQYIAAHWHNTIYIMGLSLDASSILYICILYQTFAIIIFYPGAQTWMYTVKNCKDCRLKFYTVCSLGSQALYILYIMLDIFCTCYT